jgi:hypothetical protein
MFKLNVVAAEYFVYPRSTRIKSVLELMLGAKLWVRNPMKTRKEKDPMKTPQWNLREPMERSRLRHIKCLQNNSLDVLTLFRKILGISSK